MSTAYDLLPASVAKTLPPLYSQDGLGFKAVVRVKYFLESFTWYATEYDPEERVFFGFVTSCHCPDGEWGPFSLDELRSVRGCFGLPIERDLWFDPKPLGEILGRQD